MKFDVFTLFPEVFSPYLGASMIKRALNAGIIAVKLHNIRDWAIDRHHTTDDTSYGGGGGMVMKPEPVFAAVEEILGNPPISPVILMTPQGRPFTQQIAKELSTIPKIGVLCGHYEGIDERIREHLVTDEISLGDYVLTGGELPALVVIDAISRYLPGFLGDPTGVEDDSHALGLLEYPHYTRPPIFRGWSVPDILRSGNHAEINRWRQQESLKRTFVKRPDLLGKIDLSSIDLEFIKSLNKKAE